MPTYTELILHVIAAIALLKGAWIVLRPVQARAVMAGVAAWPMATVRWVGGAEIGAGAALLAVALAPA